MGKIVLNEYISNYDDSILGCFCHLQAKTGFPWIDAIMTQLRLEGWIHPLARHAVACFLTRGDLWISWEEGMKVNVCSGVGILLRGGEGVRKL